LDLALELELDFVHHKLLHTSVLGLLALEHFTHVLRAEAFLQGQLEESDRIVEALMSVCNFCKEQQLFWFSVLISAHVENKISRAIGA